MGRGAKHEDLTERVFDRLTALEYVGNSRWRCRCACGKEHTASACNLKASAVRSCGCLLKELNVWATGKRTAKDLTGQRFGKLVVLRQDGNWGKQRAWLCQCDCGNQKRARQNSLLGFVRPGVPRLRSCGCLKADLKAETAARRAAEKAARIPKKKGKPVTVPIDPDIAARTDVSRQRKLQLQWKRMGLCQICGKPAVEGCVLCAVCQEKARRRYVPHPRKTMGARRAEVDPGLISKLWGHERVLHNDQHYCMKELMLRRGFQSSLHFHRIKRETFLVVAGRVEVELAGGSTVALTAGNHITLVPGVAHRFRALSAAALVVEASTFHDDADVVRLEESRAIAKPQQEICK